MQKKKKRRPGPFKIKPSLHKVVVPDDVPEDFARTRRFRQLVHNCCGRKLKFRWKPEAVRKAESLHRKSPESYIGVYKCRLCGGWHMTSHSQVTVLNEGALAYVHGRKRARIKYRNRLQERFKELGLTGKAETVFDGTYRNSGRYTALQAETSKPSV